MEKVDLTDLVGQAVERAEAISQAVDPTEQPRRERMAELASEVSDREGLEARHGKVWDTGQLVRDFQVLGFLAPYVRVRCNGDGIEGTLEFQHAPRFYFNFQKV
jgi:hypothetical protein